VHYWDTSAVLKLYAPEADSAYFLNLIATVRQPVHCSAISCMEVLCALYRKEEAGDLKPGGGAALYRRFRRDARAGRVVLAPYGEDVAAEAERVAKAAFGERRAIMIRSLDLIHVGGDGQAVAGSGLRPEAAPAPGLALIQVPSATGRATTAPKGLGRGQTVYTG
jgi:uncharacterized protein with PIN domain